MPPKVYCKFCRFFYRDCSEYGTDHCREPGNYPMVDHPYAPWREETLRPDKKNANNDCPCYVRRITLRERLKAWLRKRFIFQVEIKDAEKQ